MLIECLSVFVVVVGPNWTIALHNTRCPRDRFNMYAEFRMYHFQLGPIKENVSVSECAGVWLLCGIPWNSKWEGSFQTTRMAMASQSKTLRLVIRSTVDGHASQQQFIFICHTMYALGHHTIIPPNAKYK